MKTLALYYRASNEDENLGESATIQNQRDLLHHYIQNRKEFSDWNVLEFQDDGWSGTTFDRPGIQALLKLAGKDVYKRQGQAPVHTQYSSFSHRAEP